MTQTIDAVFEDGLFRPVSPLPKDLQEGQRVRVVLEKKSPDEILELAAKVYEGLSDEEIDEIERIILDRPQHRTTELNYASR